MKNSLIYSMVAMSAVSLCASADEFSWGDVTFQPRAYAGYADYSLKSGSLTKIPDQGPPKKGQLYFGLPDRGKVDVTGFLGGLGATVASGRFFGDIYYQAIPSETAYSAYSAIGEDNVISNYGNIDVKHYDWAISLGYAVTDQWSVFAGYKAGKMQSDQSVNYEQTGLGVFQTGSYSVSFDQDGPFLGTSYSFAIGPGALTLKAAYAYLNGKYTSDFNSIYLGEAALQQFSWEGNSNAYSLGISWTQSITENLGFSLGANYHDYAFDASGSKNYTSTVGGKPVPADSGVLEGGNLTEELFTLTASLFYRF